MFDYTALSIAFMALLACFSFAGSWQRVQKSKENIERMRFECILKQLDKQLNKPITVVDEQGKFRETL